MTTFLTDTRPNGCPLYSLRSTRPVRERVGTSIAYHLGTVNMISLQPVDKRALRNGQPHSSRQRLACFCIAYAMRGSWEAKDDPAGGALGEHGQIVPAIV